MEPFKTAISQTFQREWPHVAWALLCVAAGVWVYRGYCRYLCPLGAALAVLVERHDADDPRPCDGQRGLRCSGHAAAVGGGSTTGGELPLQIDSGRPGRDGLHPLAPLS